jgi:hypothetical protein
LEVEGGDGVISTREAGIALNSIQDFERRRIRNNFFGNEPIRFDFLFFDVEHRVEEWDRIGRPNKS